MASYKNPMAFDMRNFANNLLAGMAKVNVAKLPTAEKIHTEDLDGTAEMEERNKGENSTGED